MDQFLMTRSEYVPLEFFTNTTYTPAAYTERSIRASNKPKGSPSERIRELLVRGKRGIVQGEQEAEQNKFFAVSEIQSQGLLICRVPQQWIKGRAALYSIVVVLDNREKIGQLTAMHEWSCQADVL